MLERKRNCYIDVLYSIMYIVLQIKKVEVLTHLTIITQIKIEIV